MNLWWALGCFAIYRLVGFTPQHFRLFGFCRTAGAAGCRVPEFEGSTETYLWASIYICKPLVGRIFCFVYYAHFVVVQRLDPLSNGPILDCPWVVMLIFKTAGRIFSVNRSVELSRPLDAHRHGTMSICPIGPRDNYMGQIFGRWTLFQFPTCRP